MDHSLDELALVDSPASEEFDRHTRLAATMLGVPVALVSIVDFDNDRQFEPPRVYRRVIGSNVRPLFQRCSRLHRTSPLLLAA